MKLRAHIEEHIHVGFETFGLATVKLAVTWGVTLCRVVEIWQSRRGTYNAEKGSNRFLRDVDKLSRVCAGSLFTRQKFLFKDK